MNKRRAARARLRILRFIFAVSLLALILSVCALFLLQHGRARYVPVREQAGADFAQSSPDASAGNTGTIQEIVRDPVPPVPAVTPSAAEPAKQPGDVQESDMRLLPADAGTEKLVASREACGLTEERIAALMRENRGFYHFDHISEPEQRLYAELLHIMTAQAADVYLEITDAAMLDKVQNCVMHDHPEIFYINGYYSTRYTMGDKTIGYAFTGRSPYDSAEIARRSAQIEQYVSTCLAGVNPGWDDYGKIRYVYDYLVSHTSYHLDAPDNQNICSVMIGRASVCQGYAKAAQLLLNRLGIPCTLVIGTADSASLSGPHAWNMVLSNGNWYHLDVTWGDATFRDGNTESEGTNYDYLLTTGADISATHAMNALVPMPVCDRLDDNYYVREGAYFSEVSLQAFGDLASRRHAEGADSVRFKCATREIYEQMIYLLIDEQHVFDYIYKAPGESLMFTRSDAQRSFSVWF